MRVVVDTNVFVSAVMSPSGASREVIRRCLLGQITPLMGNALFAEYEDVCSRDELFETRLISRSDRNVLLDAFFARCQWVSIFYLWRPNLVDESDNHVVELAVSGNAKVIITANKKDFRNAELTFQGLHIFSPHEFVSNEGKVS